MTWQNNSEAFLIILTLATTLTFAIPLLLAPLTWARLMQWRLPEDTDLAVYFGRCLGAFICVVEFMMFRSVGSREWMLLTFQCLMLLWVFMLVIHVWGWLRGVQPITETLEIGLWALLIVLTYTFWPA